MKYINKFSKEGFVNLFADFIVKNINSKFDTRIQVVDLKSFLVVYGVTSSDEILDLNKLRDLFVEKHPQLVNYLNLKQINIIDLIDYKEPLSPNEYYFEYYKSDRPIFHQSVINESLKQLTEYNKEFLSNINFTDKLELQFYSPFIPDNLHIFNTTNFLSISSSFPYGYSLNLGRREFYYGEYICNQLFNLLETEKILLKYSSELIDDNVNIDIVCDSIYSYEKIKSLILDVFDFNLNKFTNEYLKNYDFEEDLNGQLHEKPWLIKDRMNDLIIF